MNSCPFDTFGVIAPITSIPQAEKGHGKAIVWRYSRGAFLQFWYIWHFGMSEHAKCSHSPLSASNNQLSWSSWLATVRWRGLLSILHASLGSGDWLPLHLHITRGWCRESVCTGSLRSGRTERPFFWCTSFHSQSPAVGTSCSIQSAWYRNTKACCLLSLQHSCILPRTHSML